MFSGDWSFKKTLNLLTVFVILMALWAYISSPMVVTVTGNGQVSASATNAIVSFNIEATDTNSPQNAILNANAKALALKTYLKGQGIAESDIAQSQVTAVPASLVTTNSSGYQATISMAAKTSKVNEISLLVSNLYAQGAKVVAQPLLSVENQNKLEQDAFKEAMEDAKRQASQIGLSNLKFVKKVVAVSQSTTPTTSTATTTATAEESSLVSSGNGVFKIVKTVSVTYKMW